jgi:hypothetical protein
MVGFYISAGAVILLLLIAGANWRALHLAYCKHLMRSGDYDLRRQGLVRLIDVHLDHSMPLERMRRLIYPATLDLQPRVIPHMDGANRFRAKLSGEDEGVKTVIVDGVASYDEDGNLVSLKSHEFIKAQSTTR